MLTQHSVELHTKACREHAYAKQYQLCCTRNNSDSVIHCSEYPFNFSRKEWLFSHLRIIIIFIKHLSLILPRFITLSYCLNSMYRVEKTDCIIFIYLHIFMCSLEDPEFKQIDRSSLNLVLMRCYPHYHILWIHTTKNSHFM